MTPAPGNDVGPIQIRNHVPGVFPQSACATFLGIDHADRRVWVNAVYPVLTENAVVGVPAEGAIAEHATGIDAEGATTAQFHR